MRANAADENEKHLNQPTKDRNGYILDSSMMFALELSEISRNGSNIALISSHYLLQYCHNSFFSISVLFIVQYISFVL